MRRVFLLFAVGTAVTIGAVVVVKHLATRDTSPTVHTDVVQLQTDERAVLCDFSLDLDHEIRGLWALASQPCSPETGWSRLNRKGLLASARGASLDVVLDSTDWSRVLMRISRTGDLPATGQVEIRLNDRFLGSADLQPGWHNVGFEIPTELLVQGANRFTFGVTGFEPTEKPNRQSERPKHVFHLVRIPVECDQMLLTIHCREMINKIQFMRKEAGFDVIWQADAPPKANARLLQTQVF